MSKLKKNIVESPHAFDVYIYLQFEAIFLNPPTTLLVDNKCVPPPPKQWKAFITTEFPQTINFCTLIPALQMTLVKKTPNNESSFQITSAASS